MAIRFEPSHEEQVQLHGTAVYKAAYVDADRVDRSIAAVSPLDLSCCHEMSDQEERRTSSCSPELLDASLSEEALLIGNRKAPFGHPFSGGVCKSDGGFVSVPSLIPAVWKARPESDCHLPGKLGLPPKAPISHKERVSKGSSAFQQVNNQSGAEYADYGPANSKRNKEKSAKTSFAQLDALKQNGGHPDAACASKQHVFSSQRKTAGDLDNLKSHKLSSIDSLPNHFLNTQQHADKSEGFGETDAAEALLGLSEGFYPNALSSHIKKDLTDQKLSSPSHSDAPVKTLHGFAGSRDSVVERTESTNNTNSTDAAGTVDNAQHSRFHYKKLICRKFVNSLSERNDVKQQANSTSHCESVTSRLSEQNGRDRESSIVSRSLPATTTSSFSTTTSQRVQSDQTHSGVIKSNTIVEKSTFQSREVPVIRSDSTVERCSSRDSNSNFRSALLHQAEIKAKKDHHAVSVLSKQMDFQSQTQSKSHTTSRSPGKSNKEKKNLDSNLYRISSTLGSSNESLNEAPENTNEDFSSDSNSSDSSDSDSDLNEETLLTGSSQVAYKQSDAIKRKVVLNKPTFSMPAWVVATSTVSEEHVTDLDEPLRTASTSFGKQCLADGERSTFPDNCSLHSASTAASAGKSNFSADLGKQGEIHIKRATFTFNSAKKLDTAAQQQSGLAVTSSQDAALGERALRVAKDRNSFPFDRDKLDRGEAVEKRESSTTKDGETFGRFRCGDSFQNLSKPAAVKDDSDASKQLKQKNSTKYKALDLNSIPYDKDRLPRPSARSAALEAQQLMKPKAGRKRKLSTVVDNSKEKSKLSGKSLIKRPKPAAAADSGSSAAKTRHNKKQVEGDASQNRELAIEAKQNGGRSSMETSVAYERASLERPSSRRKPTRVFKHQKYTSVSMMSSNHCPRDTATSPEFAIISRPLNLDHRVLLANSIDVCRGSTDNMNVDSTTSSPSSRCSSRTSSITGDEADCGESKVRSSSDKGKDRTHRQRHLSAIETNLKSELFKRKHKLKRFLSINESNPRGNGLLAGNWRKSSAQKTNAKSFRLLSLFPAPASLRAGYAHGELLPGYGPTVSGQRSSLPLRWTKGSDMRELKQKRQREKWRNMTLDMFCMGAT